MRLIGFVLAFVTAVFASNASAAPRLYRNEAMGIRAFDPPVGWELAPQVTYPGLLASYTNTDGARLTLAAQRTNNPKLDANALVEQSRAVLVRQGFTQIKITNEEGGVRLDAQLDNGKRVARQHYRVLNGFGYVVTLIAQQAVAAKHSRELDDILQSFNLVGPDK